MSTENSDHELIRLYRSAARELSPAWLNANILEMAARHARTRKVHARLRLIAVAAAFAVLAIAVPKWQARHGGEISGLEIPSIDRHSPLAEALRNLPVARVDASIVASCLQRNDLCSDERAIAR